MSAANTIPRRGFLKKGLFGGALLFVGGAVPLAFRSTRLDRTPREPLRLFSPEEHEIFAAVAARVVPGNNAGPDWPTADQLDCAGRADRLLALTHPEVGTEFKRLLRLFENGLVSFLTVGQGTPFSRSEPGAQDARLEAWRTSRLTVFRSGYQALVRLSHAVYFSAPETYALLGYPGPPVVPQDAR